MEYCAHCRAIRPTRKSSRKRNVRQPDGTMKTIVIDSYHCTRCNHFVGSVERDSTPVAAPSAGTAESSESEEAATVAAASETE
jgi:hypothetical protein